MHIVLTDILTCPRCGPEFGLIILADRIEDRRVVEGKLGCANCREEYPVHGGVADLRWGAAELRGDDAPTPPAPVAGAAETDAEKPLRMAALLGLTGPSGPVAVGSSDAALVRAIQEYLPETGVFGVSARPPENLGDEGMGWLLTNDGLPIRSRSLGGVVLASADLLLPLEDTLRCLGRGARVVLDPAPPGTSEALLREGAELLLEQDQVAVAFDPRAG